MIKNSIILSIYLFCTMLFAQNPIHYTTKQGLPSNNVYDIAQDSNGFMWFATNRGLVKFDGKTFKNFTLKEGLPNTAVWKIESDFEGRIWYSSKSNQQGFIKNDSVYKFYTPNKEVISPDWSHKSKDSIWSGSGIGCVTLKNGTLQEDFYSLSTFKNYSNFSAKIKIIAAKYNFAFNVGYLLVNPEAKEFILVKKEEILILDKNLELQYRIKQQLPNSFQKKYNQNYALSLLPNQTYFLGLQEGVLFIDFKKRTSKYIPFKDLISQKRVNRIYVEPFLNEIQVSVKGYLMRFDYDFNIIESISFPKEYPNHRSYKDFDGNIWLADLAKGITLIPNTQLNSNYYFLDKKISKINKVAQNVIVGIPDDGFYTGNFLNGNFKKIKSKHTATISAIQYNPQSKIGFLLSSTETLKYENGNYKPIRFTTANDTTVQYSFKNIFKYQNHYYYISSNNLFKKKLNLNEAKIISYNHGFGTGFLYKNKFYIGKVDGLFQLKKDSLYKIERKNEILKRGITCFGQIPKYLVVGTNDKGLYLFNENETIHLKNTDYLTILKIIVRNNDLWLATGKGVLKVTLNNNDLANSKITNRFLEADGLLQNNINDIHFEGDSLYVATDIGLSQINIKSTLYKKTPQLYFNAKNDTLTFKPEIAQNINISFGVSDFTNQENFEYQYRLLPYQKKWQKAATQNLNFSNLSPVLHTLEVKVIDQHLNENIAKQYLKVMPFWWQTNWAIIMFLLLLILGIGLIFYIIFKRIQKNETQRINQEKTVASLELLALRNQMNPHFVHNSLNAIQYYIQKNDVETSENYLTKFSKLMRLFFDYSQKQNITINEEIKLLKNYLYIEKLRFGEKLDYKIIVDKDLDIEDEIPAMILQPLVENAINHGLFSKKENGLVSIAFIKDNYYSFTVLITDDGIGINKACKINSTISRNTKSHATNVIKERLLLLKESNQWNINFTIKDLSEQTNTTGTVVTLTFNPIL